jgi:hypothetical protein
VAPQQRDADSRLSGIDVVPADIDYVRQEAYSFEQAGQAIDVGRLREGSPAVYIESVTYGRTMLFTMFSTVWRTSRTFRWR